MKIEQTWWHIEDHLKPSKGRTVRQVMDIYTKNNCFDIPLGDFYFVSLKIKSRYTNNELLYIEHDNKAEVNLDLEKWPKSKEKHLSHVKIEAKYTILYPDFKMHLKDFIRHRIIYKGGFEIEDFIQPEFYIIVPKGLKILADGQNIDLLFYVKPKLNEKLISQVEDLPLEKDIERTYEESEDGTKKEKKDEIRYNFDLNLEGPYIDQNNNRNRHNYVINNEEYSILKTLDLDEKSNVGFEILYKVGFDNKFYLIPIVSYIIIFTASIRIGMVLSGLNGEISLLIPYLVVIVSFSGFLLKFHEDNYTLPGNYLAYFSLAILSLALLCEILSTAVISNNSTIANNSTILKNIISSI